LFVVSVTGIYAHLELLPPLLPIAIAVGFVQYVLDSHVFGTGGLRASVLGRWNGIAYFAIAGCAIATHHYFGDDATARAVLSAAAWSLIATTAASIAQRLLYVLRAQR
jgi:hypothetical protein